MPSNTNRKALSKYKPHPILDRNPFKPLIEFFSPKKRSNASRSAEQDDSLTLPGSYPHDSKPRAHASETTTDDAPPSTPSKLKEERKQRLERVKSRMASPAPRHASSGPKAVYRYKPAKSRPSKSSKPKSKSFDHLNKEVEKTLKPIKELSDEERIFADQFQRMTWTRGFITDLVEERDRAERASLTAPEKMHQRDERLKKLLEEEEAIKRQLERQLAEQKLREVTRKVEQKQLEAELEKALKEVEEQLKEGEIRRKRTTDLIRELNKSELDIMAKSKNADEESLRVEFESLAEARKKLAEEQAATRQQFEEVAKARVDLEEAQRRLQVEEEAARARAAQATTQYNEMLQEYDRLQQQIRQLQDEKEAAQRQSKDILFQARLETRMIRRAHDEVVRETQDTAARNVTEAMNMFRVQLEHETTARMRAEEHALAAMRTAEALMAAAATAAAPQPMDVQDQLWEGEALQPMDVQLDPWNFPPLQPQPMDVWQTPQPMDFQNWEWQRPPPPYNMNPQALVVTDADRVILYEHKWATLRGEVNEVIFFQQIPWPVLVDLIHPDQLDIAEVRRFINNEMYLRLPGQENKSLRERIRTELLRWHPDRFNNRVLPKVELTHRQAVKETADRVAKAFTQIMSELPHDDSA